MSFTLTFRFTESPREEKTMKRLISTTLVAPVVITGAIALANPALASTSCTTNSDGTQFCNTQLMSTSYSNVATSTTSVASSDVKGKTNLQFQNSNGFRTSAKCVTVNSFASGVKHKCFIVSSKMKGKHYSNSGVNRSGKRNYFDDYVGSKYTPVGSKFYWDSHNRTWRKGNCGNFVRFNNLPKLKVANVALVRTFSNVTVTVKATQTATDTVTSTASCSANGTSASATAKGTGTATATATATASAKTQSQATTTASNQVKSAVQSKASAAAYAAAQVQMFSQTWVSCSSNTPPPSNSAPSVSASAQSCVQQGQANGVITGTVTNPNSGNDTAVVTIGSQTTTVSVPANGSASFTLQGFAPGTYSGTAKLQNVNLSTSFSVTVQQCASQTQTITITSMTQLNMIPAGDSSGPFNATVNASAAGGELTVDPGIGTVSDCSGGTPQGSMTFTSLAAGDTTLCMEFWAPNDASQPPTMTVTLTATLGSARDVKTETFNITYPTRP